MPILMSLFALVTTNNADIQSDGSFAGVIIPCLTTSSSFALTFLLIAGGSFRNGMRTGGTDGSVWRWRSPSSFPYPSNMPETAYYFLCWYATPSSARIFSMFTVKKTHQLAIFGSDIITIHNVLSCVLSNILRLASGGWGGGVISCLHREFVWQCLPIICWQLLHSLIGIE